MRSWRADAVQRSVVDGVVGLHYPGSPHREYNFAKRLKTLKGLTPYEYSLIESVADFLPEARYQRCMVRATNMGKAADLVEQAVHETLTYYGFPDIHWQKIRTNNPLERITKEIRRRTRVVGAFPDCQSCLNLAAARLRHIAGTTWSAKCYMNMRPLYQQQQSETEAVA